MTRDLSSCSWLWVSIWRFSKSCCCWSAMEDAEEADADVGDNDEW